MAELSFYWLASVLAFAIAMSATPGPNNAMLAASGASFGFRRSIPHILGISVGFPVMIVALAVGAAGVLRAYPVIHVVMKWAGAAYLLWLSWHIAAARPVVAAGEATGRPLSFLQAAVFQWINPKAWVAAVSAIGAYTSAAHPILPQAVVLSLLFAVACVPAVSFWTGVGVGATRVLRTERSVRAFNWAMAGLLLASLVGMLLEP